MAASAGLGKVQNWTGWLAETLWWRGGREVDRERQRAGSGWALWPGFPVYWMYCTAPHNIILCRTARKLF